MSILALAAYTSSVKAVLLVAWKKLTVPEPLNVAVPSFKVTVACDSMGVEPSLFSSLRLVILPHASTAAWSAAWNWMRSWVNRCLKVNVLKLSGASSFVVVTCAAAIKSLLPLMVAVAVVDSVPQPCSGYRPHR